MSNWKGHIVVGIIFSALFLALAFYYGWFRLNFYGYVVAVPITLFYAILPDWDIRMSKVYFVITFFFLGGIVLCFLTGNLLWGILLTSVLIMSLFFKHRGFLHSALAGLILCLPLFFISWVLAIVGFVAYVSHLTIDGELKLYGTKR